MGGTASTIINQIVVMFLLMFVGHLLYKKKILDDGGTRQLSALLLNIVTPAVLITSYQRPFDKKEALDLLGAFGFAFVTFVVVIGMMTVLYGKSKQPYARDARMCVIFSNNGFMAIPLLQALLGSQGVFLGSASIVTATVLAWTYGVSMLRGNRQVNFYRILMNPGTLALFGGILLFCSPWKLPGPIFQAVNYLGSLNTPLAMLVLGVYLSQAKVFSCLKDKTVYILSFLKLIVAPLLSMAVLYFLGAERTVAMALVIGIAAPSGVISAMMAQMFDTDYLFSTRIVAVTTLLSAITMPLLITAAEYLWGGVPPLA